MLLVLTFYAVRVQHLPECGTCCLHASVQYTVMANMLNGYVACAGEWAGGLGVGRQLDGQVGGRPCGLAGGWVGAGKLADGPARVHACMRA